MSKILLSANHIVQYFGERKILEFEKLNVYEGDRIGIVGVNGVGKTTLLNILSGEGVSELFQAISGTSRTSGPAKVL